MYVGPRDVGVGVAAGALVGVLVAVGVAVGRLVDVLVAVGVAVNVLVAVGAAVAVLVAVLVAVGTLVDVLVAVGVFVGAVVDVLVEVGVSVGTAVDVLVAVSERVWVGVALFSGTSVGLMSWCTWMSPLYPGRPTSRIWNVPGLSKTCRHVCPGGMLPEVIIGKVSSAAFALSCLIASVP